MEASGHIKDFNKLKLVTHCFDSKVSEQNLLKEYLAYRLYNQLTKFSYEIQLVRVKYVDTEYKYKSIEKYAIILEDKDEMVDRLDAEEVEQYNVQDIQMNNKRHLVLAMFQYMIGNTDWRIDMMHNLKLLRAKDHEGLVAIPYDFDFSGLVNASYARPNPDLGIFKVRDRLYQGFCATPEEREEVKALFLDNKDALLALCANFEQLHKRDRKDVHHFIANFFEELENSKRFNAIFNQICSPADGSAVDR